MYMIIIVFLFTTFLMCFNILHSYRMYWSRKHIPTVKESSLKKSLGILFITNSIWKFVEELYWRYDNKYVGFFMLHTPSLFVKDLSLIKRILVKDFEYFPDRTLGRNPKADTLGAHFLFLEKGNEWKFLRTKIIRAYSIARVNLQIPLMEDVGRNLCAYLSQQGSKAVDVKETCAKYSTDVITSSAYGIDGNSFTKKTDNYRLVTERIFSPKFSRAFQFSTHYVTPFLLKYFGITFVDKVANVRLEKTYKEQMKLKKENNVNKNDFLDFLIQLSNKENHPKLNLDHVTMISQAAQYFLAGYETIGSTFAYMLYELAKHEEIQTRLRVEIINVMKNHDGNITTAALKDMIYLDMILRETMRLYPILPFLDRKVTKDYKIPDTDIILEKGTNVYISIIGMHYDPKYFPDPSKFNPERFSPENKNKIEPFTYLPFGGGPRICIGARFGITTIKTGVIQVIRNFKVSTCSKTCQKIEYLPSSFVLIPTTTLDLIFNKI